MTQNEATMEKGLSNGKDTSAAALKDRAMETLENGVETTQETLNELTQQASDEFRKLQESGTKFVRENPGTALAGAVGVGILVGLALRGRH